MRNDVFAVIVVGLKCNTKAHCVYMDGYVGRFGPGALPPDRHGRKHVASLDWKPKSGLSPEEMSSVLNSIFASVKAVSTHLVPKKCYSFIKLQPKHL